MSRCGGQGGSDRAYAGPVDGSAALAGSVELGCCSESLAESELESLIMKPLPGPKFHWQQGRHIQLCTLISGLLISCRGAVILQFTEV